MSGFKESNFSKTCGLIWGNNGLTLLIFFMDLLFFGIIKALNHSNIQSFDFGSVNLFFITIIFVLILFIFLTLYSLMKYIVVHFIRSFHKKTVISFENFPKFILLNLNIAIISYLVYGIVGVVINEAIKFSYRDMIFVIVYTILFVLLFFFVNISQFIFLKEKKVGRTLAKTFSDLFNFRLCKGIFFGSIFWIVAIYILYGVIVWVTRPVIIGIFMQKEMFSSFNLSLFNIMGYIIVYVLLFFNRIYLMLNLEDK